MIIDAGLERISVQFGVVFKGKDGCSYRIGIETNNVLIVSTIKLDI